MCLAFWVSWSLTAEEEGREEEGGERGDRGEEKKDGKGRKEGNGGRREGGGERGGRRREGRGGKKRRMEVQKMEPPFFIPRSSYMYTRWDHLFLP